VARKGKKTGVSDMLFDEVDPYGAVIGQPVTKPVERFPLESIRPDPEQPRRLLPGDLAKAVNQGEKDPSTAMKEWQNRIEEDAGSSSVQEMRELRRLAAAIEQHGLINPITIRPSELGKNRYIIVTGERRYWAHVLLDLEERQIKEGDNSLAPDKIRATLAPVGVFIRAHQIVENLMREDINVVEKANGLWALRRELSNDAYRRHSEIDKDKKPLLIPWSQVEESLDLSRQYRLRIVSVLDLSEDAQQLIDNYNLAEATIRPIVEKLKKYPDLQMRALHQLIAWQAAEESGKGAGRRIVPSVRSLVNKFLAARETPKTGRPQPPGLDFGKFRQRVRSTLRYMQNLDDKARTEFTYIVADNEANSEIVEDLQALRNQIDEMLVSLSD
jgi:ParB-like chromosome segregation protein Spo0J